MYTQKHTKHTHRRIRLNFAIVFTQKTLPSVLVVPISFDYVRMKKMSNKKKTINRLMIKLLIKSEHVNIVNINKNRPDKINHSANKNRSKT